MSNNLTPQQLYDRNNNKLKAQDEILTDMIVVTDNNKVQNEIMRDELKNQDGKLKDMKQGMDKIDSRMRRVNKKIGAAIVELSFYTYYTIIAIEVIALLLIGFLL